MDKCAAVVLSLAVSLSTLSHAATYSGGSGTPDDPYRISSKEDLLTLAATTDDYNQCFSLTEHIDLMGESFTVAVIAPDTNIYSGFQGIRFKGIFDGRGHTISNLIINGAGRDYIGLFGYVDTSAQIRNLGVVNAAIEGGTYVGRLAGTNGNVISNCYTTGTVTGKLFVGGLVGYNGNQKEIDSCYATGTVNGMGKYTGGLVGYNNGYISDSYATGSVQGIDICVGGLVGQNYSGTIYFCHTAGSVSGMSDNVGGLVGYNLHSIQYSYSTVTVEGSNYVGGLAGCNDIGIVYCYATGDVNASGDYAGGLAGINNNVIDGCYATGAVAGRYYIGGLAGGNSSGTIRSSYSASPVSGLAAVGGLIGQNYADYHSGTITSSFWDTQTSGTNDGVATQVPDPAGAMGRTTAQMMTIATFTDMTWDFSTADGNAAIWMMLRPGEDYPRMAWQEIYAGDIAGLYGVDLADYAELARNWMNTECPVNCEDADIDSSGTVNFGDLFILAENWMRQ